MKIFYFSGSGNSLWTARTIGEKFSADVIPMIKYRNNKEVIVDDDVIGIVSPTYMNDIPWIVKEFMIKLKCKGNPYIFAVMTANHGHGGKGYNNIDAALLKNGISLSAAFDLQMPGDCIESTASENAARLMTAPSKASAICEAIESKEKNFNSSGVKADILFVQKSWFYMPISIMKNFKVTDKCTGCEICVKMCPMNNISIKDGKAKHGMNCAACYACFHWCPENAMVIKAPTISHRSQYHHPEVKPAEMFLR